MRLKGEDTQGRSIAPRKVDHMLVPTMHPVKITNRGRGAAIFGLHKLVVSHDPHTRHLAARPGEGKLGPFSVSDGFGSVEFPRRRKHNRLALQHGFAID